MSDSRARLTPMKLRERLGLTQVQMAYKLGKSPSTIAKWEARKFKPVGTPSEIKAICLAYQCTLEELIEAFEDDSEQKGSADAATNSADAQKGGEFN